MHVRDEDLELYLLDRLEKGLTLTLESHLTQCQVCATKLSSVAFFDQFVQLNQKEADSARMENRREPRISVDDPGVLQTINPFSVEPLYVRILDISKGGMKVSAPNPLETRTMVKVRLKGKIVFGVVRHCRMVGDSYHAGIQFYDTSLE